MAQLFAFDLDDTLAPSKSELDPAMAHALGQLLTHAQVAVISGGAWEQFESQLLAGLMPTVTDASTRAGLHLLPTCGTQYRRYRDGEWTEIYSHPLDPRLSAALIAALEENARRLGLWEENPWGEIIEDRGSQITFSALGQQAPLEAKRAWDPTGSKKESLRAAVAELFPELSVRGGGSTSVDITMRGVDKAYGLRQLMEHTGLARHQIVFIGDRMDAQGNDYPALGAGVACHWVEGWEDCLELVRAYTRDLAAR